MKCYCYCFANLLQYVVQFLFILVNLCVATSVSFFFFAEGFNSGRSAINVSRKNVIFLRFVSLRVSVFLCLVKNLALCSFIDV